MIKIIIIILICIIGILVGTVTIASGKFDREEEAMLFRESLLASKNCNDECCNCKNKSWCVFARWH